LIATLRNAGGTAAKQNNHTIRTVHKIATERSNFSAFSDGSHLGGKGWMLVLRVRKTKTGYTARATPPETLLDYETLEPKQAYEIIEDLKLMGARARQIEQAFAKADALASRH
jgi:hypothetical protein